MQAPRRVAGRRPRVATPCSSLAPVAPEKLWPEASWLVAANDFARGRLRACLAVGSPSEQARCQGLAASGRRGATILTVADAAAVLAGASPAWPDTGFQPHRRGVRRADGWHLPRPRTGLVGITGEGYVASVGGRGQVPTLEQVQQPLLPAFHRDRAEIAIAPSLKPNQNQHDPRPSAVHFSPARRCCRWKCWNRCADLPDGIGTVARSAGASVMEISHRGKAFEARLLRPSRTCVTRWRYRHLPRDLHAGGAWGSSRRCLMNLLRAGETADYPVSGGWSKSAVGEAAKFGAVNVLASSETTATRGYRRRNEWKST